MCITTKRETKFFIIADYTYSRTVNELQAKLKKSYTKAYRWINNCTLNAFLLVESRYIYFLNAEVDYLFSLNAMAPSGQIDKLAQEIYSGNDMTQNQLTMTSLANLSISCF